MKKPKIDAKQAVDDIRAGMDDSALMAKYHVSAKGLESLLDKLVKAGALDSAELDRRHRAFSGTVIISRDLEIVSEDEPEPAPLAKPEPGRTPKSGQARQPISARAVTADVRSGMDDAALMAKYDLSSQGLDRLFRKLVSAGAVQQAELDARMPSFDQTVDLGDFILDMKFDGTHEGTKDSESIDLGIAAILSVPYREEEATQDGGESDYVEPAPLSVTGEPGAEGESIGTQGVAKGAPEPGTALEAGEESDSRFVVETLWYEEPAVVYLLMFTVFPLGFYLLHRHPTLSVKTKAKAAGIWCLVLIVALIFKPGDSGIARNLVDDLNKSGDHCYGQISGIFDLTLRIDWTSRTRERHVRNVMTKIMAERKRLMEDGVRYLEYPNNAGTYNVIDFKTGERTAVSDEALPWFKAETLPSGKRK